MRVLQAEPGVSVTPGSDPSSFPYPSGTKVRCLHRTGYYVVSLGCEDHIFEIVSEATKVDFGCGWSQSARCLYCNKTIPPIDAETWWYLATPDDIQRCVDLMMTEADRLIGAARILKTGKPKPLLRNITR